MRDADFDYELFFDLSPDLLCIAGYDGYFKKVNPAVSKLLGYSEDELYSRPIDSFVSEEDRAATSGARSNIIESHTLFNFENRYVTKHGDLVWLAWTAQPVDRDKLVFAIAKDITQKKKLESERLELLEDLTRINRELKQFSLTTSHDLRSPVGSLIMLFELLDVSKISDAQTLEFIELLKSTGADLEETLSKYVDVLSATISGQSKAEDVDLSTSLNDVIQSIDSLIKTSHATIRADFSEARLITFNKTYMDSVFLNLITNAIKYSRSGIPPVISVTSERSEGQTRLIVADNGLGFDLENVGNRLFGINQTFHRHKDSKGVGLYLVHSHITSMGGEIHVESKVNEGTRFIITFNDAP